MKKIYLFSTLLIIVLVTIFAVLYYTNYKKTGYIRTGEIYNDFRLKKELEKKLTSIQQERNAYLDSLKVLFQAKMGIIRNIKDEKAKENLTTECRQIESELNNKQTIFQQENNELTEKYNNQIIKHINEYVQEYGKEHGYTYIFGTSESGNIMYAKDAEDITKEVNVFINKRFEGEVH